MSDDEVELSETEEENLSQIYGNLLYKLYKIERKLARSKSQPIEKFDEWAVKLPENVHEKLYLEAFAYLCI